MGKSDIIDENDEKAVYSKYIDDFRKFLFQEKQKDPRFQNIVKSHKKNDSQLKLEEERKRFLLRNEKWLVSHRYRELFLEESYDIKESKQKLTLYLKKVIISLRGIKIDDSIDLKLKYLRNLAETILYQIIHSEILEPAIKPKIEHFFTQFNHLIEQLNDDNLQEQFLNIINGI